MIHALKRPHVKEIYHHLTLPQKIGLGVLFLFGLATLSKTYESTTYAFFSYTHSLSRPQAKDYFIPTFITIPSLEIALPIDETSINYGFWGLSQDGASHLAYSPVPGQSGNTVIYAKNTPDKFGRLTSLNKGDEIDIVTQDGVEHTYKVTDLVIASPTESSWITDTKNETLTLYTPYGFGDLERFVVRAQPIR